MGTKGHTKRRLFMVFVAPPKKKRLARDGPLEKERGARIYTGNEKKDCILIKDTR